MLHGQKMKKLSIRTVVIRRDLLFHAPVPPRRPRDNDFIYIANDLMTRCECQQIKLQDTADFSIFCPVSSLFLLFFFLFCLFLFQIAIVFALILHFFFFARPPLKKMAVFFFLYINRRSCYHLVILYTSSSLLALE